MVNLDISLKPVASQVTDIINMANLKVSLGPVANQITDIIAMVNLEVSMGPVASQVTDIINMVNLKVSLGPVASLILNRHNRHGQHVQKLSSTHANESLYSRSFHNRCSLDQKSEGINKHRRQHVPSRNDQRGYNRQTFCWFCGESNHTASVCRHGTYITCNTCNMTGHKSKMCTYH